MTTFNTKILTQIGFATLTAVATLAYAGDMPQVHVKYADLNVDSPAGARVLYQRIKNAAAQVCGASGERELVRIARAQACSEKAIADAVVAVGSDALNKVYTAKTGNTVTRTLAAN